jgi:hypothetical protein
MMEQHKSRDWQIADEKKKAHAVLLGSKRERKLAVEMEHREREREL